MWRLVFSFLFSIPLASFGQIGDTTWVRDWKPSFIRIGTDITRLIQIPLPSDRNSFSATTCIDFDQYFFVLEGGKVTTNRKEPFFTYKMNGQYFSIGLEKNVMKYDQKKNVFSLGVRYNRAWADDQITYLQRNETFGDQFLTVRNPTIMANWLSFTAHLNLRILNNLYMGYVLQLKTALAVKGFNDLVTYDIPGYGRHRKSATLEKNSTIGFNYFIYYTIPWREKVVPVKIRN